MPMAETRTNARKGSDVLMKQAIELKRHSCCETVRISALSALMVASWATMASTGTRNQGSIPESLRNGYQGYALQQARKLPNRH